MRVIAVTAPIFAGMPTQLDDVSTAARHEVVRVDHEIEPGGAIHWLSKESTVASVSKWRS